MTWDRVRVLDSAENVVKKYVFEKEDAIAEAVLYGYPTHKNRTVICCSTQSGCPVGCRFCGAGDSFVRSLRADEIVSQPTRLLQDLDIPPEEVEKLQIMFMSMGEPMLNYRELAKAIRTLHEHLPEAALLISTSGPDVDYKPLEELSAEISTIGLQFSVHESTDKARNELIPFVHKLDLAGIASQGESWHKATGRRPFFNYCAHDKNTAPDDASRLAATFNPEVWEATVSVVCEREENLAAANERQKSLAARFMHELRTRGFSTRMFDPAGQDDIGGGCGQLWFVQEWMDSNPDKARKSAGRGLPVIHTPKNVGR